MDLNFIKNLPDEDINDFMSEFSIMIKEFHKGNISYQKLEDIIIIWKKSVDYASDPAFMSRLEEVKSMITNAEKPKNEAYGYILKDGNYTKVSKEEYNESLKEKVIYKFFI